MGFKLGKFLKKAVKLGVKLAKPILATTPVGALALRAQQTFKSLGGNLKAARLGKIEPLSVRASMEKTAPSARPRLKRLSMASFAKKKASRIAQAGKTPNGKGRRSPPAGGLDLRRMALAWRAAGKPGSWRDWIRTNQLRKGA